MKLKLLFRTTLLLSCLVFFTHCKKDIEALLSQTSTITFINPTYTTISISFNGETKTIAPGGSVVFTGDADAYATGTASTSGQTSSGSQVGLMMTWSLVKYFPTGGDNINSTLNVGSDYFFLKMANQSTINIQKVYVNYGTSEQTVDNLLIPNNGVTYSIGYYKAYTNSSVRAENGATYWSWTSLGLPWSNNQAKTVTAS